MSRTQHLKSLEQEVFASARVINDLLEELYETKQELQRIRENQAPDKIQTDSR